MKLAIPAEGTDLNAVIDSRFGRCQYLLVVEAETMSFEALENPFRSAHGGAGIKAAQFVSDRGVKAVLAANIGPNAFKTLKAVGIPVVAGLNGEVRQAVEDYKMGKFETSQSAPSGQINDRACSNMKGKGLGPGGECVCLACGTTVSHRPGFPCREEVCPKCGGRMRRK
ncbi:MAG TPA: dinitrogenase iron-molybdenum cofactor biosynthesis protein [Proteobacteria bacterium]|nr:dinitrogenase iron-molybdenum cofactor biosynthesis protein [Pseudomonadota bacterium]